MIGAEEMNIEVLSLVILSLFSGIVFADVLYLYVSRNSLEIARHAGMWIPVFGLALILGVFLSKLSPIYLSIIAAISIIGIIAGIRERKPKLE
jgi:hypothetical protein